MAERAGTHVARQHGGRVYVIEWTGLLQGDTGAWMETAHYGDKTLHVYGTYGGATVTLQGSNENTPSNGFALTTPTGALSFTSNDGAQVLENPLHIRPVVTGGDGTTSLTARVCMRRG